MKSDPSSLNSSRRGASLAMRPGFDMPRGRGFSFRQMVLTAAVAGAVAVGGLGGYVYYRNNSTTQLAQRAQIALEQHDSTRAIDFVKRALDKNPRGETAVGLRDLMARALIEAGREEDARVYIHQALAIDANHAATLDLLAKSYVNPSFRRLRDAFKPISAANASDLCKSIDDDLEQVRKLPRTARNLVAQGQLHRLYYLVLNDQARQAAAALDAAHIANDNGAATTAQQTVDGIRKPEAQHREAAIAKLQEALTLEPGHQDAASLLGDYQYEDHRYGDAIALYEQLKKEKKLSDEVALTAARSMIADAARQPDKSKRLDDARQVLQSYLKDHPDDQRLTVALGDILLDQGDVAGAAKLAERAAAQLPRDLYAQILLVNCRLHENKSDEAIKLITPLTTTFANKAEVWYLLGQAETLAGDMPAAGNAFRKALAVNPGFTQARQELLAHEKKIGNEQSASLIAAQVLKEDRYNMDAWKVTIDGLRKTGQLDRARGLLVNLANDPDLPMESRPDLIAMLSLYGAPQEAQRLLATLPQNDTSTLSLRAMVASASGNSPEARSLMARAVAANPGDVELRLRYVDLLAGSGLGADVRSQLDQVMASKTPLTAEQAIRAARGYLSLRLPAQAAAAVKPILEKNPRQADALAIARQGQALLASGQTAPATLPAAIDLQSASIPDIVQFSNGALEQKNYQDALGAARAGLARDKNNADLRAIAARALAGLGQIDQAVDEIVEAARTDPGSAKAFAQFVDLFPNADAAIRGIGYAGRLESINPALAAWAMGKLAELSGQLDLAMRYYQSGLGFTSKLVDARPAKDQLYQALVGIQADRKDASALKKTANDLASADATFAVGIRLLAADQLLAMGDRQGSAEELEAIKLSRESAPRLALAVAGRWLTLGQAGRARSLIEAQLAGSPNSAELLDGYATLLMQAGDAEKAVEARTKLAALDPGNPRYKVVLADAQANAGDIPGAMRTLDDARSLGATGAELADAARLRLLISLGLLDEATRELQKRSSGDNDFGSMLAVAQAWAQLNKPQEARSMAASIPPYAAQYSAAQAVLASLDLEAGENAKAVARLEELPKRADGAAAADIGMQLFRAYLRAGDTAKALQLASDQRGLFARNTPGWRAWTTYAATAAREGKDYARAIAFLDELDPEARKGAALDVALMNVLQHKPVDVASLSDDAPAHNRSTLEMLAGAPAKPVSLNDSLPSCVIAAMAGLPETQRASASAQLAHNPNLLKGDIDLLLKQAGSGEQAAGALRQVALAQRLIEAGWTTTALDVLSSLEKNNIAFVMVQRHQALTDLHRFADADKVREAVANHVQNSPQEAAPSERILLAAGLAKQEKYQDALKMLEPLESLGRPDVLTTMATLHEKLGQLHEAVALHRQVLKIDPGNLAAANNLAYTLAASRPNDKAALAEAREAIEMAIGKAPQITAFQDTKGWIQILSGQAAEGTQRIARVLPLLRLDPAVHYHLGMGYARTGQNDLARLHLENVAHLAHDHQNIPELPLASEALRALASTQ